MFSVEDFSQAQRERLNYIDFKVFFTGQVGRGDLIERFGIKEAAATRDLQSYQKYAPQNIVYDHVRKVYLMAEGYKRCFIQAYDAKKLLVALIHGMGDDFSPQQESLVPCELPTRLYVPNIDIFAALSRALSNKYPVRIKYFSTNSNAGSRVIIPYAFAGNGLRWHIRAYDRKTKEFRDFVVNRILDVEGMPDETILEEEFKENDIEWNRKIELEITPHPNSGNVSKKLVEHEYGMQNGLMTYTVRAAMAGYIMRLWNVDCSPDHHLIGKEYMLWLRNGQKYKEVRSFFFAPGWEA